MPKTITRLKYENKISNQPSQGLGQVLLKPKTYSVVIIKQKIVLPYMIV